MSTSADANDGIRHPGRGAPAGPEGFGGSGQACLIDGGGRIVWVNASWREFASRHGGNPVRCGEGIDYLAVCAAADRKRFPEASQIAAALKRVLSGAIDSFELEYSCPTPAGDLRFVMRAQCLNIDGRRCAFVLHEDVTRARFAEQMLRESEERYRQLFAAAPDAVFMLGARGDELGRILDANEIAAQLHGYTRAELIGMRIGDLDVPQDAVRVRERIAQLLRDRLVRFEAVHRRRDGSEFPVEVTARLAEVGGRPVILSFNRDQSDRQRVQEELRHQAVRLELAARSSLVGFWDWDLASDRVLFSPEWKAQLGYAPHEIGEDFAEWQDRCHPDDVAPVLARVQSHVRGEIPYFDHEFRMRHRDGGYRWIYSRGQVVRDVSDKPLRLVGCHVDISERKTSELQRSAMASRIERVQRLEAIGTLAGGIAHDFNNILTVIAGNVELALKSQEDPELLRESLGDVRKAADRAKALVRQILAFSRNDPPRRGRVAVATLLSDAQRLLRSTVSKAIEIQVEVAPDVPDVFADNEQMQQVLVNLGTNAWHAIGDQGGAIRMTAVAAPAESGAAHAFARIEIRDDGCGMDAVTMTRIFEPFFTTKEGAEGTGLGLSVVHGIITKHEGTIEVASEVGKGTTFTVLLPAAGVGVVEPVVSEPPESTVAAHVLLLDDQAALLRVISRGLERLGLRVTSFEVPDEALAALRASPAGFDVVVTDYDMPGVQGLDVTRQVKAVRRDLPVVLCSGFLRPEAVAAAAAAGVARVLNKPFTAKELAAVVRELLAAG